MRRRPVVLPGMRQHGSAQILDGAVDRRRSQGRGAARRRDPDAALPLPIRFPAPECVAFTLAWPGLCQSCALCAATPCAHPGFRALGLGKRDGTKMEMDKVRANRWARARCVVISRRRC